MNKKLFFLYTDYKQHLNRLSLEEKGMLLDAIFDYAEGNEVDLDGVAGMAFSFISAQMDRDNDNYEKTCESHREAGSKGGAPKGNQNARKQPKTTKNNQNQPNSNKTSKTKDIDKDIDIDIDIDKDIYKGVSYQQVVDLYNNTCVSLPRVSKLSDSRKRTIKARLKNNSLDDLKRVFELAEESDFLKGSSGSWTATFDWLMNETNMVKVLDGNYKNKQASTKIEMDSDFRKFLESNQVVNFNV